ncbi:MAG: heat shock protein HspQ [Pseudomonadales bacterium]|jgi:heat shock protein HspQ|nr:heat shock protein HspQ [Pseudomonadales bacterium]MDP7357267.1 heat shock protein HspQ [Pseudomonadales bacterium]MDP7597028.1 heat shock protein HspQ [Pseudomonadales bacterium]HJN49762.1 heat shock protein HspQ [Pseudomonadales bacterium]|tara:strand:- start:2020 stop:2337 length:318 start_codon:yes stop_codon:yes gene_type:complete
MTDQYARFARGQQVTHHLFNYRGVIFDVDPVFLGSEAWYQQMAKTKPPKNAPWYHILVHGADHTTYVAERNLEPYNGSEFVDHPLLDHYFDGFDDGLYHPRQKVD